MGCANFSFLLVTPYALLLANTCQDMIMRYAYDTGSDTHLTVRVPIPVPRYGTVTLPVSVAAPCISGKVRLDGRFETCSFDVRRIPSFPSLYSLLPPALTKIDSPLRLLKQF